MFYTQCGGFIASRYFFHEQKGESAVTEEHVNLLKCSNAKILAFSIDVFLRMLFS